MTFQGHPSNVLVLFLIPVCVKSLPRCSIVAPFLLCFALIPVRYVKLTSHLAHECCGEMCVIPNISICLASHAVYAHHDKRSAWLDLTVEIRAACPHSSRLLGVLCF